MQTAYNFGSKMSHSAERACRFPRQSEIMNQTERCWLTEWLAGVKDFVIINTDRPLSKFYNIFDQ